MLSRLYCVLRKKRRVGAVTRRPLSQQANSLLRTVSRVFRTLEKLNLRIAEQFGAGDGNRTHTTSLGIFLSLSLFSIRRKRRGKKRRACSAGSAYGWGTLGGTIL